MNTQAAPGSAGPALHQMLKGTPTLAAVAAHLEPLSVERRAQEAAQLGLGALVALWELASAAAPLAVSDVLPATREPFKPLHWAGKNSLPLFSHFEKRFYRDEAGRVWGYNHQAVALAGAVTGPGYFAVTPHRDNGDQVLVDYARLPERAPPGWPPITSNSRGLSYLVFHGLEDSLRRVCDGVVIGKANKAGQYFSLVRLEA
jgi:hypothetical protein